MIGESHREAHPGSAAGPASPQGAAGRHHRFRPEIQALRAIAVVAVMAYHVWPDRFPGGFVGVDVFFVVSGFLITGNMLREVDRTGRLSLAAFWAGRVRRILPAALVAIGVTALVSIWLLPLSRLPQVSSHALASAFYAQNWLLSFEAVDYLAQTGAATPFEHFWSLAVEEQFYILWPLVVIVLTTVSSRRAFRRRLAVVFAALVATSFLWAVVAVQLRDPVAYFSTATRLWELGVGALLALIPGSRGMSPRASLGCATASIAVVFISIVAIRPSHPFPGLLALVPVAGAALMVIAGPLPVTSLSRALGWRPVQWLGDASYSLYLWHYPAVVFLISLTGAPPGLGTGLGIVLLSLALAAMSFYWVEQPTRRSTWLASSPRRALSLGGLALVTTGAVALVPLLPVALHRQEVASRPPKSVPAELRGALAFDLPALAPGADPSFSDPALAITPDPAAELDLPVMPGHAYYDCQATAGQDSPACEHDPAAAVGTLAVVGDSNSTQYLPALLRVAEERGWRVVLHTRSECPFNPVVLPTSSNNSDCPGQNERLLRHLLGEGKPDIVFTAASSSYRFEEDDPQGARGYASYWKRLTDAGIRVVAVRPMPRPTLDPVECVSEHLNDPMQCAEPREVALREHVRSGYDLAFSLAPEAEELDLSDETCSADRCFQVLGNTLVYRDKAHYTVEFVETLTDRLRRALS